MILTINGMLVEPTDFVPTSKDNPYYNVEVRSLLSSLTMRFNHTQFFNENPEWKDTLKELYDCRD